MAKSDAVCMLYLYSVRHTASVGVCKSFIHFADVAGTWW